MANQRFACEYYTKSYPMLFRERILRPFEKFLNKRFRRYDLKLGLNYANFLRKNFVKNSIELYLNNNKKLRRYRKAKP
jgi:hypothetical protein